MHASKFKLAEHAQKSGYWVDENVTFQCMHLIGGNVMTTKFKLAEHAQKSGYMKMSLFNVELDLCIIYTL
jgi:hypothetical protein